MLPLLLLLLLLLLLKLEAKDAQRMTNTCAQRFMTTHRVVAFIVTTRRIFCIFARQQEAGFDKTEIFDDDGAAQQIPLGSYNSYI